VAAGDSKILTDVVYSGWYSRDQLLVLLHKALENSALILPRQKQADNDKSTEFTPPASGRNHLN
jgi:hypothetical protein